MILDTMKYSDFMFLSETWLRPNEPSAITNQMRENNYWCVMKSSMDPEAECQGRPYGGVICKKIPGVTYIPMNCDNDRICAIQMVIDNKVQMTVVGMYMPYYDGTSSQIALCSQTLEDVQCMIDTNDPSPVLFLGDMNAGMPNHGQLSRSWYRSHPYSRHSLLYRMTFCVKMACIRVTLTSHTTLIIHIASILLNLILTMYFSQNMLVIELKSVRF